MTTPLRTLSDGNTDAELVYEEVRELRIINRAVRVRIMISLCWRCFQT